MPLFPGWVAANQTPDVPSGEGGDGYFHVDIAEVQAAEGKLYLFVAIGRTSRFACVELHLEAGKMVAAAFLRNLIAAVPCRIHIVLTEALLVRHRFKPNGGDPVHQPRTAYMRLRAHLRPRLPRTSDRAPAHQDQAPLDEWSGRADEPNNLMHVAHKWIHVCDNGHAFIQCFTAAFAHPIGRAALQQASVKRFHPDNQDQLRNHLTNFISACNFGRRLKTLKGLTPYEFISKQWTLEPERFALNPIHQMPGPSM